MRPTAQACHPEAIWIYSPCALTHRGWAQANLGPFIPSWGVWILPPKEPSRTSEGGFPQSLQRTNELPPENALVAAILRQVLIDIGQKRPTHRKTGGWISLAEQLQAIEFVVDQAQVEFWANLIALDPAWLQQQLLAAAGLSDDAPRLGERPAPAPRHKRPYTKRNQRHA